MPDSVFSMLLGGLLVASAPVQENHTPGAPLLPQIEVVLPRTHPQPGTAGRLIVVLDRQRRTDPRRHAGDVDDRTLTLLARDVGSWEPGQTITLDRTWDTFPPLRDEPITPGEYTIQATLRTNMNLNLLNAPGDHYSNTARIQLQDQHDTPIQLTLDQSEPPDVLPADTDSIRYIRLRSHRLSNFHGRPIHLRAAVVLPRGFDDDPQRNYPLRLQIGGYGARFTEAARILHPRSPRRAHWLAHETPKFLLLHLDGAGPLGDPYQVNSANHGPYGDALIEELIPHVEQHFRGNGRRVVTGGSTGGWVSLALQIFYPDHFQGCWSFCADPVDFRKFERVNIYEDPNAYRDSEGRERPACRNPRTGAVRFTMRQECGLENVLGRGGSWALSGGQWGAWNATFGPRGPDGSPVPLWHPQTGEIDRSVLEHWKQYDLRLYLESNWTRLAPKLCGKIHIWMGDADDYFLNESMQLFQDAVARLTPPADFTFHFGPGQGHCWSGIDEPELTRQMAAAVGAKP